MFLRAGSLHYVNHLYAAVEQKATVIPKQVGKHTVQMDKLWSFVDDKGNKQWVPLAIDAPDSGSDWMSYWRPFLEVGSSIMGFPTECLSPAVPRFILTIGKPMLRFYARKRHKSVGKESGLTSYIERLNNTLRQRVSRLVRKTLSFSKKLENHKSAIWNFIHDYNHQIRLAMLKARLPEFYPSFT